MSRSQHKYIDCNGVSMLQGKLSLIEWRRLAQEQSEKRLELLRDRDRLSTSIDRRIEVLAEVDPFNSLC